MIAWAAEWANHHSLFVGVVVGAVPAGMLGYAIGRASLVAIKGGAYVAGYNHGRRAAGSDNQVAQKPAREKRDDNNGY